MAEQTQTSDMAAQSVAAVARAGTRLWLVVQTIMLVLFVVLAIIATQSYFQRGLPAFLGDWQFQRFGQSLPAFNIAIFVIVALLIIPLADLVIRLRRWRQSQNEPVESGDKAVEAQRVRLAADADAAHRSAQRFVRLLTIVAGIALVAALMVAVWGLLLPRTAPARMFAPAAAAAGETVRGRPDGRLMITTANDVLLYRNFAHFVPVIDPAEPGVIRRFVEFIPGTDWDGVSTPQVDVSKPMRAYWLALPSFTHSLYAGRGVTLAPSYEVLTNRPISIQLPYYISAIQLALVGLIVAAAAWIQRRHLKRMQQSREETSAAA
jgi:uncharacterized membrane protein